MNILFAGFVANRLGEGKNGTNKAACGACEKSWKSGKASRPSCQRNRYARVRPGSAYRKRTPSCCQRKGLSHVDGDNDGGDDDDSDGVADAVSASGLRSKAGRADFSSLSCVHLPLSVVSIHISGTFLVFVYPFCVLKFSHLNGTTSWPLN